MIVIRTRGIPETEVVKVKTEMGVELKDITLPADVSGGMAWNAIAPRLNMKGVTNASQMFFNANGANFNPDVSDWDVSSATDMQMMFYGCKGANFSPNLRGWDTSNVTNFNSFLYNCSGANFDPDVRDLDFSSATNLSNFFYFCNNAKFHPDLTGWDTSNVTMMSAMFGSMATSYHKVAWIPRTFVATRVTSNSSKPFYTSPGAKKMDVYTDATDAASQGWGTPNANYIMHYNATHDDYLEAKEALI